MQTCISPIKRTVRKIRSAGAAQSFGYCLTVVFCRMLVRLNTVTSQSKTIYVLFPQFSLTLVKFMTTSKLLLESRFDTS